MQKKVVILSIIGVISISIGFGIEFIHSLKEDRVNTLARMDVVVTEYKNFSDAIDTFNDIRNSLYLNYLEKPYFDTMAQSDASVKEMLSKYEISVNNITAATNKMVDLCGTIYFPDSEVNKKCKGFPEVYEQVVNSFVSDVKLYNNNILKYNDYQKENGTTLSLEGYQTDKKYIDFNKDKKYDGKEE